MSCKALEADTVVRTTSAPRPRRVRFLDALNTVREIPNRDQLKAMAGPARSVRIDESKNEVFEFTSHPNERRVKKISYCDRYTRKIAKRKARGVIDVSSDESDEDDDYPVVPVVETIAQTLERLARGIKELHNDITKLEAKAGMFALLKTRGQPPASAKNVFPVRPPLLPTDNVGNPFGKRGGDQQQRLPRLPGSMVPTRVRRSSLAPNLTCSSPPQRLLPDSASPRDSPTLTTPTLPLLLSSLGSAVASTKTGFQHHEHQRRGRASKEGVDARYVLKLFERDETADANDTVVTRGSMGAGRVRE